jgi:transcriptional regulator with XRE-family HTH domain
MVTGFSREEAFLMSLQMVNEEEPIHEREQFSQVLQKLRLAGTWKQNKLAARLGVKLRTYISWEKGERIPPLAMVVLLSWVLEDGAPISLFSRSQLLKAYTMDELERQIQSGQGNQVLAGEVLLRTGQDTDGASGGVSSPVEQEVRPQLDQLLQNQFQVPLQGQVTQQQEASDWKNLFDRLYVILEMLKQRTDLIPVAEDFLTQMTKEGE